MKKGANAALRWIDKFFVFMVFGNSLRKRCGIFKWYPPRNHGEKRQAVFLMAIRSIALLWSPTAAGADFPLIWKCNLILHLSKPPRGWIKFCICKKGGIGQCARWLVKSKHSNFLTGRIVVFLSYSIISDWLMIYAKFLLKMIIENKCRRRRFAVFQSVKGDGSGRQRQFVVDRNRPHWHALRVEKSAVRHGPCMDVLVGCWVKATCFADSIQSQTEQVALSQADWGKKRSLPCRGGCRELQAAQLTVDSG